MCKIYNTIGSLTTIKNHLHRNNITEFNSLKEVINFQNNYSSLKEKIISDSERQIEQEKSTLIEEISELDKFIQKQKSEIKIQLSQEIDTLKQLSYNLKANSKNTFQAINIYLKKFFIGKKILAKELSLNYRIIHSTRQTTTALNEKIKRYQYILTNFTDAVNKVCYVPLTDLERKKRIIDEISTSIYGALGEQKVVRELENLSNEYFLINDFSISFRTPIYNRQEKDYIKSIQIDHLLISPSGVFLIETKNWSENSINNPNLWSPVKQVKRTSFALFKILNGNIFSFNSNLNQHHWGKRKIPIRNIIVLTNLKPSEEFDHVKVLTLRELISYVKYFKPSFSFNETEEIASYLLTLTR